MQTAPILEPSLSAILDGGGIADRVLPGWEARPEQIRMAEAVKAKIEDGGVVVVEAPTGVGKTLAYLVPAALSNKRVVISTNTKTLQDQIIGKDLPRLTEILSGAGIGVARAHADDAPVATPGIVRYALMKGRSNYLCIDRLEKRTRQGRFDFEEYDLLREIREWASATERGDRAELIGLPERAPLWDELDARSEICSGKRCDFYEDCWVVRMRREAQNADIIIVNHHLLLADLALQAAQLLQHDGRLFGAIIPEADALILDEAHALEEIATEYFGGSTSTRKLERLLSDLAAFAGREGRTSARMITSLARAAASTQAVFGALPKQDGRVRVRPHDDTSAFAGARRLLPKAEQDLAAIVETLDDAATFDSGAEPLGARTREFTDALRFVLSAEDPDYVYWSERAKKSAKLGASPIDVAQLLSQFMFDRFDTVALTSATLSAGDAECKFFKKAVGAPEGTTSLVLGSPFDYSEQAVLFLPEDAPEGNARDATERAAAIAKKTIDVVGGGALFLFTSYRAMHAAHAAIARDLDYPVFMQGERPKAKLLEDFVRETPAVLFATASFWEGVDVPGDPLRLVLIDRLPFDPPNDPLALARGERLEALGKSAFASYFVPRAILRLKQGFGRLVRTQSDRGVVAILDRRIRSRSYGRRFLTALPNTRRIVDLGELEAWWRSPPQIARTDPH